MEKVRGYKDRSSPRIGATKINNVNRKEAQMLRTANNVCLIGFDGGGRRWRLDVEVKTRASKRAKHLRSLELTFAETGCGEHLVMVQYEYRTQPLRQSPSHFHSMEG